MFERKNGYHNLENLVQGYPVPNCPEEAHHEDLPVEITAQIQLDDDKYRELCTKAAALDILTAHINATGKVNDDVVYAVTGTTGIQSKENDNQYQRWWLDTIAKNEALIKENEELKQKLEALNSPEQETADE